MGLKKYALNLLIAGDQFLNAGADGYPDETISSRCARQYGKHWYWTGLGKILEWLDPGHLRGAIESEKNSLHEPPELR